jgi:hypothetical protein
MFAFASVAIREDVYKALNKKYEQPQCIIVLRIKG